jgi:sucrose synthase
MASGLPTFAPKYGGPLEIIEYGKSGYLMNTSKPELIAASLEKFVAMSSGDATLWQSISEKGIERVHTHFNWRSYSRRLIHLTKLYGFWRYAVSEKGMLELDRYCDVLYHFLIKKRFDQIEKAGVLP